MATWIRKTSVVFVLLLTAPFLSRAACDFRSLDAGLLGGYYVALLADYHSTRRALAMGHAESNPLLGDRPTTERLLVTSLLAATAVTASACWLDGWKRTTLLSVALAIEIEVARRNYALILRTRF